jgi:AraC-like DNA-binding protein
MEITYSLQSTLDIIFLIQGVLFGILLITLNKKQKKDTLFLGVFMILFGLSSATDIVTDLNLTYYYPKLKYLPFDFLWLLFPVLYIYVQKISIFSSKKKYYILIPGFIEFLYLGSFLFLDENEVIKLSDSFINVLLSIAGVIFSIMIMIKTFILIKRHARSIKNQYSSLEYKEVIWVKYFTLSILLYFLFSFITIIFAITTNKTEEFISSVDIIATLINLVLVFWASFKGITQSNVTLLIPEEKVIKIDKLTIKRKDSKQEVVRDNDDETEKIIKKLQQTIEEDQLFNDVDLTIVDVSEKIGIHPKKLSTIINSYLGSNFNQFINSYRVEKAKELLKNNLENNLTIDGIAYEVGFKSKSSFYSAFKKNTQMTPVNFKKELSKKSDIS